MLTPQPQVHLFAGIITRVSKNRPVYERVHPTAALKEAGIISPLGSQLNGEMKAAQSKCTFCGAEFFMNLSLCDPPRLARTAFLSARKALLRRLE